MTRMPGLVPGGILGGRVCRLAMIVRGFDMDEPAKEKRPIGRPSKYDPVYCDMIVEHMSQGASATSFAAEIDVARSTITEWAAVHPEFSVALMRGKAKCAAWWEKVARVNAVTGDGSAPITIFGLSNMGPEDWKQKQEIDHTTKGESLNKGRSLDDFYAESDVPVK